MAGNTRLPHMSMGGTVITAQAHLKEPRPARYRELVALEFNVDPQWFHGARARE